jgi:S1-C subfamily serine protease
VQSPGLMKKCTNCGYVRRPEDDEYAMVPPRACPRCFAFYPSDQIGQFEKKGDGPIAPPTPAASRARWLSILVVAVAVTFAAAFYLAGRVKDNSLSNILQSPAKILNPETNKANAPQQPVSISDIVKRIAPSVVSILNYNDRKELVSRGTGFFIGNLGEVITNHHVLKGAAYAEIKTSSGQTYPVNSVISEDAPNDLITVSTGAPSQGAVPLRISTYVPEIGEKVIVIGSPLGLEQTVSDGIVSAFRQMKDLKKVIQITAPISSGSSGSPVVNSQGEVIGIAFMQLVGGQNLNFCIPGETIVSLRPNAGYSLGKITPYSPSVKLYFYQDENRMIRFVKNPDNTGPNYILLTRPDGSIDREKFENWIFEQMGGNPYNIDPQALVNAEKDRLPELFRSVFPGHEIDELKRFSPEARGYWGSWVANHMQAVYSRAENSKNSGIMKHKEMMAYLDRLQKQ